jgi:hypothetical protein
MQGTFVGSVSGGLNFVAKGKSGSLEKSVNSHKISNLSQFVRLVSFFRDSRCVWSSDGTVLEDSFKINREDIKNRENLFFFLIFGFWRSRVASSVSLIQSCSISYFSVNYLKS